MKCSIITAHTQHNPSAGHIQRLKTREHIKCRIVCTVYCINGANGFTCFTNVDYIDGDAMTLAQ